MAAVVAATVPLVVAARPNLLPLPERARSRYAHHDSRAHSATVLRYAPALALLTRRVPRVRPARACAARVPAALPAAGPSVTSKEPGGPKPESRLLLRLIVIDKTFVTIHRF